MRAPEFIMVGIAAGAGAALYGRPGAVVVAAIALVAGVLASGWRRVAGLLVASTYVTVLRIDVVGAHLRLEHVILLLCVAALVWGGRGHAMAAAAGDRTVLLFGGFVAWSAVVSALRPPQPGDSLLIVGWLALDWLMLVVLIASGRDAGTLARTGLRWASVAGVVALVLWIGGRLGVVGFGITPKVVRGVPAGAGVSFEPNLLGATMALWAFVAITCSHVVGRRASNVAIAATAAGLAVSFTRAAFVGLAAGLLVWAALGGPVAIRRAARVVGAGVACLLIAATVTPGLIRPLSATMTEVFDFNSGTGRQRAEGWTTAVGDLQWADWLVGVGTNSFGQRHLDPTLPADPTPAYLANLPLQVLYDTGIVGVVLLLSTVASCVGRERLRDGRALGLIAVYVVCATATSPFWYGTTWILVAVAVLDRKSTPRSLRYRLPTW